MALAVADIVNNATTTDAVASTTRTVNLPTASVETGDIMYICMAITSVADIGDVLTTPSGWTFVAQHALTNTASTPRGYVYKRIVPGGGLGSTIAITSSDSAIGHVAVAFAVQTAAEELDHTSYWYNQVSAEGTISRCPSVLARQTGGLTIRMIVSDDDDQTTQATMTGHTTLNWAEVATPGNGCTVQVWSQIQSDVNIASADATLALAEEWAGYTFIIADTTPAAFPLDEVRIEVRSITGLNANITVYTFSDMEFGVPGDNRKVVVCACSQNVTPPTALSITIGGNSLSFLKGVTSTGFRQEAWGADISTGTRGDIVVTWSAFSNRSTVCCFAIYNAKSTVHDDFTSVADPLTGTIDIPAKGSVLGSVWARVDNDVDFVWTNADLRAERSTEFTGNIQQGASKFYATTQTALAITANPDDVTPIALTMIGISWDVDVVLPVFPDEFLVRQFNPTQLRM